MKQPADVRLYRDPHGALWIVQPLAEGEALAFRVYPYQAIGGRMGLVACARRSGGLFRVEGKPEPWHGARRIAWPPKGEMWADVGREFGVAVASGVDEPEEVKK